MNIIAPILYEHKTVLIVTMIFILIDILTGVLKAFHNGSFTSNKMREGLYHKASYMIIIIVSAVIEIASKDPEMKFTFDVPLINTTCIYIIFTDFMSILENLSQINPDMQNFLKKYMKQVNDIGDETNE